MILIVSNNYPENSSSYGAAFIHKRALLYKQYGFDSIVVCPSYKNSEYEYERIHVVKGSLEFIKNRIDTSKVKAIFIHFLTIDVHEVVESLELDKTLKRYVWIHGFEAEAWHRRYFIFSNKPEQLLRCIEKKKSFNDKQIDLFRQKFNARQSNYIFIHVSKWFKDNVVECDVGSSTEHYKIIPNPVDSNLFRYSAKDPSQRFKVLIIRSFASPKYANDISVAFIQALSKKPYFNQLDILICGDGELFPVLTKPLLNYSNVTLKQGILSQYSISNLHKEYGIFLCPTRWDSQGVSMCEAMSSGMVVLSSNVSAIPEFVKDRTSGFLCDNDPAAFVAVFDELIEDPELFSRVSLNSGSMIREICGHENVTKRELALINQIFEPEPVNNFSKEYWQARYLELESNFEVTIANITRPNFIYQLARAALLNNFKVNVKKVINLILRKKTTR